MLISWIMNTIEPSLRLAVTLTETVEELCTNLKERFLVINGLRIQQLKAELVDCKQHRMTMVNYYGKSNILWDELEMYE